MSCAAAALPVGYHRAPFQGRRARRARWPARPSAAAAGGGDEAEAQRPPPPPSGGGRQPGLPLPITMSSQAVSMTSGSVGGDDRAAAAAAAAAGSGPELAAIGKWAEHYRAQLQADTGGSDSGGAGGQFILPLMTLSKVKLPTESVPLQIFEPRYRLMFKLVNQSASRRFGVVLADKNTGLMESVGCLCELTHFVTVPERRRLFINARVIGRFRTEEVVNDKPFLAVVASQLSDSPPQDLAGQLQLAALEMRVWQTMQEVKQLAAKLFAGGGQLGNDIFSLEVRRWSPDASARADVPTAAGADPTLMRMVQLAGLLGDETTMAERTTEYLCSDATRQVTEDERRERFSFALARTLDLGPERLQQLLYTQSTAERLRAAEELILEGRNYLAARSTLRDTF